MSELELVEYYKKDFYQKTGNKLIVKVIGRTDTFLDKLLKITNLLIPDKYHWIEDISKTRYQKRDIVYLKQSFCYIASKYGITQEKIAEKIGYNDRSSVSFGVSSVANALEIKIGYENLIDIVTTLENKINDYERNVQSLLN